MQSTFVARVVLDPSPENHRDNASFAARAFLLKHRALQPYTNVSPTHVVFQLQSWTLDFSKRHRKRRANLLGGDSVYVFTTRVLM